MSAHKNKNNKESNAGRVWNGYAAYKPEQIEKLLTIFRCFHNFIHPGEDKQTPAMRIGLAKGPVVPLIHVLNASASKVGLIAFQPPCLPME